MKTLHIQLLIIIVLACAYSLHAQQPTKEEIEEMKKAMKEMKADPEMMEAMKKMGMDIKMVEDAMNAVEKNGTGAYYELDEFQTPKKDDARIAAIPKGLLTKVTLPTHLTKAEKRVEAVLGANDRKIIDLLMTRAKSYPPDSLTQIANSLWVTANYLPAAYIMGKAAQMDPNGENLNNYAAFLVMLGGEDLALPILQKLNRENPKNSTILNNIGQAWFGLGDLDKATKYLDSTIMIAAWHPQANMTKCVIQKSKGNNAGAIQSMKNSVKGGYSTTKEDMLRKLGYKLDGKDLDDDFNMPADPLGFDKWIARIPQIPKDHKQQMALIQEWETFYEDVKGEERALTDKLNRINQEVNDKMRKEGTNKMDLAKVVAMNKPPQLSAKANHILNYYTNDKSGKYVLEHKRILNEYASHAEVVKQTDNEFLSLMERENAKCEDGEGKKACPSICPVLMPAYDKMVSTQNALYERIAHEWLELTARTFDASAYYFQYSVTDQLLIDQNELRLKLEFIKRLKGVRPRIEFNEYILGSCVDEINQSPIKKRLAEWNDLHCDKDIRFAVIGTGYWRFTCNTTEFHLEPVLLPIEVNYKENLETGQIIAASAAVSFKKQIAGTNASIKVGAGYDGDNGTVKLEGGVSTAIGSTTIGDEKLGGMPVKASAGGSAFIEFDKNGISDLGFKAGVDGKPDLKYGEKNNEANFRVGKAEASVKWSWNAGGSGEAKGTLNSSINPTNFSGPPAKK